MSDTTKAVINFSITGVILFLILTYVIETSKSSEPIPKQIEVVQMQGSKCFIVENNNGSSIALSCIRNQ